MTDVIQTPALAATTTATPARTATSPTVGASFDAEIVALKSRVGAIETAGKKDWATVVAWVKTNWAHFVTWAAVVASNPIALGVIKKIL